MPCWPFDCKQFELSENLTVFYHNLAFDSGSLLVVKHSVDQRFFLGAGEGAGAGAGLRAEETLGDGEDTSEERASSEGAAVPVRGGPEEPTEDAGAGGEAAEQDEGLQETSGAGCESRPPVMYPVFLSVWPSLTPVPSGGTSQHEPGQVQEDGPRAG